MWWNGVCCLLKSNVCSILQKDCLIYIISNITYIFSYVCLMALEQKLSLNLHKAENCLCQVTSHCANIKLVYKVTTVASYTLKSAASLQTEQQHMLQFYHNFIGGSFYLSQILYLLLSQTEQRKITVICIYFIYINPCTDYNLENKILISIWLLGDKV